ncbi:MAG: MarR family transcriptional regulator [Gemmatimonadota bacterium]|nr:MarR family transcriptional regulator [Gemmatimonadota bacterium]
MAGDRLGNLLERLGSLLHATQRGAAGAHGLQRVHLDVLGYLLRCNRYSDTPTAVGEYLGLTKGTVSQSLRVLEARGLLTREPDVHDGRVVRLRLTRRGRGTATRERDHAWERLRRGTPAQQRATLELGLERLLRALQAATGYRTFGLCRSCRFLRRREGGFQCGLTGDALSAPETGKICREHEAA